MTPALEALRHITTGTINHRASEAEHQALLDERPDAAAPWFRAAGRPGLHAAFRAGARDLATPESWSKPISTRGAIEAQRS
jgi:hypothetical protein